MDKISEHIIKNGFDTIGKALLEMGCDHEWEEHGHGYICKNCEYYTGGSSTMNDMIKAAQKAEEAQHSSASPVQQTQPAICDWKYPHCCHLGVGKVCNYIYSCEHKQQADA